jgi:malyl-CoA/(S)-citramalyl-CoA lyase
VASAEGKGADALDGRLIDVASIKQAESLVARAHRIEAGA